MKNNDFFIIFLMSALIVLFVFIGFMAGREKTRLEAIKNGHAEFRIVDKETGKTEFFWKEIDK